MISTIRKTKIRKLAIAKLYDADYVNGQLHILIFGKDQTY